MTNATELSRAWNNLDRDDKLEIIGEGIDMYNVSEGFIMLRLYRKSNHIGCHVQKQLDNHLCVEAVSQATLSSLFSEDHEYQEEDAEVILQWMENQG